MRSRASSLPRSRCRRTYFSPPPASASGVLGLQLGELGEHGLAVGLVVGSGGIDSGLQNRHSRVSGMSR